MVVDNRQMRRGGVGESVSLRFKNFLIFWEGGFDRFCRHPGWGVLSDPRVYPVQGRQTGGSRSYLRTLFRAPPLWSPAGWGGPCV